MRILVACEFSGVVRRAFRERGHDAWSCDLEPAEDNSEFHIQGDCLPILDQGWDMMIGHPPCDYLTNSAAWAFKDPDFEKYPGYGYHQKIKYATLTGVTRRDAREKAVEFFLCLWKCGIPRICIENPIGHMNTHPDLPSREPGRQIIQPHQFGDDASKSTVLWLRGLPMLQPTGDFPPRYVCQDCGFTLRNGWAGDDCPICGYSNFKPRWSNQTDSGQNRLSPSEDRASKRAVTYHGIAEAMAEQWGNARVDTPGLML